MIANSEQNSSKRHNKCMMSRRDFLLYTGAATAVSIVPLTLFAGTDSETQVEGRVVGYPRKKIAKLSQLINHIPVHFQYPDEGKNSIAMLGMPLNLKPPSTGLTQPHLTTKSFTLQRSTYPYEKPKPRQLTQHPSGSYPKLRSYRNERFC